MQDNVLTTRYNSGQKSYNWISSLMCILVDKVPWIQAFPFWCWVSSHIIFVVSPNHYSSREPRKTHLRLLLYQNNYRPWKVQVTSLNRSEYNQINECATVDSEGKNKSDGMLSIQTKWYRSRNKNRKMNLTSHAAVLFLFLFFSCLLLLFLHLILLLEGISSGNYFWK